ncbi:uncharacterized protein SAPINGB_P003786 [Magnusiomyces paraingens]|uniref:triacylglycerol lipase n=1 Tax=Magnusiomyces paraingens TaxID=2606893 RepID=A0A5E8BTC5_9ASCO|nr:uncharacterized protein SAPINGB_P003786 [Saprochaete ingens]VVT53859.1 unnamed protein product [Saprochaete ingens]
MKLLRAAVVACNLIPSVVVGISIKTTLNFPETQARVDALMAEVQAHERLQAEVIAQAEAEAHRVDAMIGAEIADALIKASQNGGSIVELSDEHSVRYYPPVRAQEESMDEEKSKKEEEAYSEEDKTRPVKLPQEYFANEDEDRNLNDAVLNNKQAMETLEKLKQEYSDDSFDEEMKKYIAEQRAAAEFKEEHESNVTAMGVLDDHAHRFNIDHKTLVFLARMAKYTQISYCVESLEDIEYPFICRIGCTQFPTTTLLIQWYEHGIFGRPIAGYMAVDDKRKELVVMFRGAIFPSDIANSWNLRQTPFVPAHYTIQPTQWRAKWAAKCKDCKVQTSLYRAYLKTMGYISGPLHDARAAYPGYRIVIGGHNVGGMMAALAGVDLKMQGFDVTVVTFGASKYGNAAMTQFVEELFGLDVTATLDMFSLDKNRFYRVTRREDPFTHWPYMRSYTHTKGEVYISDELNPMPGTDVTFFCLGSNSKFCSYGDRVDFETLLLALDAHYYYFVQFAGCATLHSYLPIYQLMPPAHEDDPY